MPYLRRRETAGYRSKTGIRSYDLRVDGNRGDAGEGADAAAPLARHSMPIMSGEATRLFKARDAR